MAKTYTLQELAELVQGEVVGDPSLVVSGLNAIELAGAGEITFVLGPKQTRLLAGSRAAACIVPPGVGELDLPLIRVPDPDFAAAVIHNYFLAVPFAAEGIDPSVHIGAGCEVPAEVTIKPLVYLGDRVRLGQRVTLHPGVVIGNDSLIGDDTVLYANVTIAAGSVIGSRVVIHSGAVIGSDGFGFATDGTGHHLRKPQVGTVRIDDEVEIGANSCIDRAAFGTTRIRSGVKIDNLVQLAHNVEVGENSIIVAQVGIAGSTTLGRNVVLGGKAAVAGHLHLDDRVMAAGMSGIHGDLPAGSVVGGYPAMDVKKWGRAAAVYPRLPEMLKEIRRLRREVDKLARHFSDEAEKTNNEGKEK
ncbi:MAG: UDP-3-O-(3-hydroxymyristoyl)glucosamine N-acyltransferase [Deltaproteobacteria bacterium]|nr:UDP-3-O-(3-hydroxymyristoyl)glucosamine N-acyltransferase [Deltaproteobacteria bacterium]